MRSIRDPATDELRDSLSRDWTQYLTGLGLDPIPVVNGTDDPAGWLRTVSPDAVLLTNGEDLGAHPPRDRTERVLLDTARSLELPVLGVCRGHQFLNDYFGGDVVRIEDELPEVGSHAGTTHEISVDRGIAEKHFPRSMTVNSYHNMAVPTDAVAQPLEPFATTPDGAIVEGSYHTDERIASIQWHPERPSPDPGPTDEFLRAFFGAEGNDE